MSIDLTELQKFEYNGHMYTLKQIKQLKEKTAREQTPESETELKRLDKINILKKAGVVWNHKVVNTQIPNEELEVVYNDYINKLKEQNGQN